MHYCVFDFGYERPEPPMRCVSQSHPNQDRTVCAEHTQDPNKSRSLTSTRAPCCQTRLHHAIWLRRATQTDDNVSLVCLSYNARLVATIQERQGRSFAAFPGSPFKPIKMYWPWTPQLIVFVGPGCGGLSQPLEVHNPTVKAPTHRCTLHSISSQNFPPQSSIVAVHMRRMHWYSFLCESPSLVFSASLSSLVHVFYR